MPRSLALNQSTIDSTENINNKLEQLQLIKERSSKDIAEEQINKESEKQEAVAKTSFNNDDNSDNERDSDDRSDKDEVCVQKVMQVSLEFS